MEYGLIPTVNQYADNKQILLQQVEPSNKISELKEGKEPLDIIQEKLTNPEEISETKKISPQTISEFKEVVLTNMNFGFNDSSKDFFVRAIRGESSNQFPTDDMMRLKAYFIAQAKAELAAE